jgi:hypothetical protein
MRRHCVLMERFRWIPKERFSTFHALFEAFGANNANIGMSTGQNYRMSIFQIEFLITNHAMQ